VVCAGIDLSLTSPAICINLNGDEFSLDTCTFNYLTDNVSKVKCTGNVYGSVFPNYVTQSERYHNISNWALQVLNNYGITKVFLEDYSFGSTGRVFHIAENTGVLKYTLWRNSIEVVTIPPSVVKKIATNKGNANKELMQEAFISETGVNFKSMFALTEKQWNPSSDLIDSYYICKYGSLEYSKQS